MSPNRTLPFTEQALKVRNWEKNNMPHGASAIGVELILIVSRYTLLAEPISLKSLFMSMSYSEAGIRKHLRYLTKYGWISIVGDKKDKRIKRVVANIKLLDILENYSLFSENIFYFKNLNINKDNLNYQNEEKN